MPLIKDKYGAKGVSPRSKFVTREFNKAIQTEAVSPNVVNTEQKQATTTEAIRVASGTSTLPQAITQTSSEIKADKESIISGVSFTTVNSVENIFTLNKGESLADIIISHYQTDGTVSGVGVYWSATPIEDLEFQVSSGVITATKGGAVYRLLQEKFTSHSTLSIRDSGIYTFNNVSTDIYFYSLCSVLGIEITIIKS